MVGASRFSPVSLPAWSGDEREPKAFAGAALSWALSPPVLSLAAASGWPDPPGSGSEALRDLVARSSDWDFRGQRERNLIARGDARVGTRIIDSDLVLDAAAALGLVHPYSPTRSATDLVVLSGLVRACVNRTRFAAGLIDIGVSAERIVVLTAHRPLGGDEPEQAQALGLGHVDDELDVVVAATRAAFRLDDPDHVEEGRPSPEGGERSAWTSLEWRAHPGRPSVEVLCAPSSEPLVRRANTHDQLMFWASRRNIGPSDRVLLVTTQIYVPYQLFEAVRSLGFETGCEILIAGVDAAASSVPTRAFGPPDYLQEVRSALRSVLAMQPGS